MSDHEFTVEFHAEGFKLEMPGEYFFVEFDILLELVNCDSGMKFGRQNAVKGFVDLGLVNQGDYIVHFEHELAVICLYVLQKRFYLVQLLYSLVQISQFTLKLSVLFFQLNSLCNQVVVQ